jgi:hypothetical protein
LQRPGTLQWTSALKRAGALLRASSWALLILLLLPLLRGLALLRRRLRARPANEGNRRH